MYKTCCALWERSLFTKVYKLGTYNSLYLRFKISQIFVDNVVLCTCLDNIQAGKGNCLVLCVCVCLYVCVQDKDGEGMKWAVSGGMAGVTSKFIMLPSNIIKKRLEVCSTYISVLVGVCMYVCVYDP